ncbi:MAG TPA: peptidylprolyl isomerase [Aliiroseovarius sp.]|nr:peptidylprolyl isomerase [Aliiroseovarius sp.]
MLKTKTAMLALLLATTSLAPALAQDTAAEPAATEEATPMAEVDADTVLAMVNGAAITVGHVVATRSALPEQYQSLPDQVLFEGILEQLIQQTLLSQAIGELSRKTELELENERRALIAGEKLDEVMSEALTEEALQKLYDETYANAEPETEYNASHILVETKEEGEALIQQLNEGADFAELAKTNSTGPSGPGGGALGWFSGGMMVEPFETAVMALKAGDISAEPVQTQFGWHVIKLNETRDKPAPALADVAEELVQKLQDNAVEAAVTKLLETADVERTDLTTIDPAVLRNDALLQ